VDRTDRRPESQRERLERLEATISANADSVVEEARERATARLDAISALRQVVGDDPAIVAWMDRLVVHTLARSPLGVDPDIMDPYERWTILTDGRLPELERVARGLPPGGNADQTARMDGTPSDALPERDSADSGADRREDGSKSKPSGCRGGCSTFRQGYVAAFWEITEHSGQRATYKDLAERFAIHERTAQRFVAGCPGKDGAPRHTPLTWPPSPPS
jgi:hypothetical protein